MYQKIIIVLFFIVVGSTLYFLFFASPEITNYPSKGSTIVMFGDSLAQGVGARENNDIASLLSIKIGEPVINMGVSGNTTANGLERVDDVIRENPKIVLVLLGGNDFLRKVPVDETFKNLDQIVGRLQDSGAVVILLGIRGGVLADPFALRFEELSKRRKTFYIPDVLSGIITRTEYMSDAIHPNDQGYARIADRIYPILKKAL